MEVRPRTEMRLSEIVRLCPHCSPPSQVGRQNADRQAYIHQPETRENARILNFREASQGTAGPDHPQKSPRWQAHPHVMSFH